MARVVERTRSIIKDLLGKLGEIAKGNFSFEFWNTDLYKGEYAPLLSGLYDILDDLNVTMREIHSSSQQVNASAEQVSDSARSLSDGANKQASSIENLSTTMNAISVKIEETAGGIRDTLKESYYTKDESKALISEEGISKFTSKDEFEIAYNRFIQDISAIQSGTAAEFLKIKKYLHFGEDGVTIGEVGTAQSNICIKIDNDRISFLDNGAEVAYWKNRNFYAVDGEFLNSLKLGRFAFIPRKNGNLSFVKVVN